MTEKEMVELELEPVTDNDRKHPLLSRKLWVSVGSVVAFYLSKHWGFELEPELIAGIALAVVAYVLGEAYIDAKAVRK